MVLSISSTCTLEEVAACCNAVRFFQLCVYKRRDITAKLVQRAENNGYKAIVLTGDSPRHGRREADIKNKIIIPELKNVEGLLSTKIVADKGSNLDALANQTRDPSFSWEDIGWLKSITKLPILIKGLLTHEDALKALEVGAAGIIVSNHGGGSCCWWKSSGFPGRRSAARNRYFQGNGSWSTSCPSRKASSVWTSCKGRKWS
ncbi:hypothetical protein E1A91_D10G065100v1 [Gossypium mustelinum]|nr:hypothetical protein E1A91_D10G065100v1 [Gossypium mustelinum]TYI59850.1 hypothetical protein E1A91_D10G065100v1 [Gossypium mustelinum]